MVSRLSTQTVNFNFTRAFSLRPGLCKGAFWKGTCHKTILSRACFLLSTIPCTHFDPGARHGPTVREYRFLRLYSPSKKAFPAIVQEIGCLEGILIGGCLEEESPNKLFQKKTCTLSGPALTILQFRAGFVPGEAKAASEHYYSDRRISTGKYVRWILLSSSYAGTGWFLIRTPRQTAHSMCSRGSWRSSIRVITRHDSDWGYHVLQA